MRIKTASDAKHCLGKKVEWDDISPRYRFVRTGVLEEYCRGNVMVSGDWLYLPDLKNLRTEDCDDE